MTCAKSSASSPGTMHSSMPSRSRCSRSTSAIRAASPVSMPTAPAAVRSDASRPPRVSQPGSRPATPDSCRLIRTCCDATDRIRSSVARRSSRVAVGGSAGTTRSAVVAAIRRVRGPEPVTMTGGTGVTDPRTAPMTSLTRVRRSAAEPQVTPSCCASCSASGRPEPMPSSKRPSESNCRAAVSRTTARGVRVGAASTQVRSRRLDVYAPAAARAGKGDGVRRVSGTSNAVQPWFSARRT